MRSTGRTTRVGVASICLALLAAACGSSSDNKSAGGQTGGGQTGGGAKQGGVFRLGIVEPTAIDPYNSQESEGTNVNKAIFEGLVSLDNATAELKPGVAQTWSRDDACNVWTFKLVPNTQFSNGETVTAQSFIDGMTRAALQKAASDTAQFMSDIQGFDAIHGTTSAPGTATTLSGLSAPDPNTLQVKLSAPNCDFDKKTLQPVFSPVPKTAGAAEPHSAYAEMPIGNGPFKMKEPWQHDKSITLVRNDTYHGTKAGLDEVDFSILPSQNALDLEYKNFQAGQADFARIPPELQPQAKAQFEPQGQFIKKEVYGINYLLVSTFNAPLNNADSRKAISYAIDRDSIISGVFKGFQTKATSIIPPQFKDYYQAGVCTACTFDVAKAKDFAAKGGLKPGTHVSLLFNTGGGHEAWTQAIKQQLEQNLGLVVDYNGIPFKELLVKEAANDSAGLYRAAWSADYPSVDDFLRPLLSKTSFPPGDNRGRYSNDAFETLINKGLAAKDQAEKVKNYKDAEKLAIDTDMGLIPLWYRTQYRVVNTSKFSGIDLDFFENPTLATIRLK
ncbi:MAG: peptide ABC transporter substrate-binding protein [Aquihabitans sp.]